MQLRNITLISTEHRESRKCNSEELYKILEKINPDVIFEEEADDENYKKYYTEENIFTSLEIKCIKKILQNHHISHIPVDIKSNFNYREWDYMFDTFKSYDIYKETLKEHCFLRDIYGFNYLNSMKCSALLFKTKKIEEQLIEFSGLKKSVLLQIYKSFHKEHQNRENGMLQNIFNYCKLNQFNQGVFLLGFAHRKSIIEKIENLQTTNEIKLNWKFYEGQT